MIGSGICESYCDPSISEHDPSHFPPPTKTATASYNMLPMWIVDIFCSDRMQDIKSAHSAVLIHSQYLSVPVCSEASIDLNSFPESGSPGPSLNFIGHFATVELLAFIRIPVIRPASRKSRISMYLHSGSIGVRLGSLETYLSKNLSPSRTIGKAAIIMTVLGSPSDRGIVRRGRYCVTRFNSLANVAPCCSCECISSTALRNRVVNTACRFWLGSWSNFPR